MKLESKLTEWESKIETKALDTDDEGGEEEAERPEKVHSRTASGLGLDVDEVIVKSAACCG